MSDKEVRNEKDERDALEIINDPKYHLNTDSNKADAEAEVMLGMSRRDLLKYGGAAAAALSMAGAAATGFETGRAPEGYTGYGRQFYGADQFFNREPFRAETAAMMEPVGKTGERVDWHQYYLRRWKDSMALVASKKWNPAQGVETMPGHLGEYYRSHAYEYENFLKTLQWAKKRAEWMAQGAYDRYALHDAYKKAYNAANKSRFGFPIPEDPVDEFAKTGKIVTPEFWDFRNINKKRKQLEFKSPQHASELIKMIAHRFGASFVGITDLDPKFVFKNVMRGYPKLGLEYGDRIPEHWKNIIVYAVPMEWEGLQTGTYSTAADGYFRVRVVGGLLERFIQEIGYPARAQTPVTTYEVMITPYVLKSGLGEYARAGYAMIPEVGSNFRSAGVITNIDFELDKPINIGMAKFCKKCKICADTCPSGAIETGDEPKGEIRGFKRWFLDYEKCHQGWQTSPNGGCAVCVAVCPFTRKNTWIHAISRELDARDSFGIVGEGLLAMQMNFFRYPTAEEFMAEFAGGKNDVYHNPTEWLKTEEWFSNIDMDWEYEGMH